MFNIGWCFVRTVPSGLDQLVAAARFEDYQGGRPLVTFKILFLPSKAAQDSLQLVGFKRFGNRCASSAGASLSKFQIHILV